MIMQRGRKRRMTFMVSTAATVVCLLRLHAEIPLNPTHFYLEFIMASATEVQHSVQHFVALLLR